MLAGARQQETSLRVAMYTPLPPVRSGTADYAAAFVDELRHHVDLHVFDGKTSESGRGVDQVVYHIANNDHHAEIYHRALRRPGVVVLHEATLHHLILSLSSGRGHEQAYANEVFYELYGSSSRPVEDESTAPSLQPKDLRMTRRLLSRARACIVHSTHVARETRVKGFEGPVAVIPHGAHIKTIEGGVYRRKLGLGVETPLIGVFGYRRPAKREEACLEVLQRILKKLPDARMLFVGQPHPEVPLLEWSRDFGVSHSVVIMNYQEPEEFEGYLAACDVVLNLRQPSFGESSGTVMKAAGLGVPSIVSDVDAFSELPDNACVKIPNDKYQDEMTFRCLLWLLRDRSVTRTIGLNAQEWARAECSWSKTASEYAAFLRSLSQCSSDAKTTAAGSCSGKRRTSSEERGRIKGHISGWAGQKAETQAYLEEHSSRLVRLIELIPSGTPHDSILELGCYMQITPALKHLLGYGNVRGCYLGEAGCQQQREVFSSTHDRFECTIDFFDAEKDEYPYEDNLFSTVICAEVLEHLQDDPMHMVAEIHRILKPGGSLVVTTPNAVSLHCVENMLRSMQPAFYSSYLRPKETKSVENRHAREYTPLEIRRLLQDAGFIVNHLETGSCRSEKSALPWVTSLLKKNQLPTQLRAPCIFAVGRKHAVSRSRYPTWLY